MQKYQIKKVEREERSIDYYCDRCGKLIGTEYEWEDTGCIDEPSKDYFKALASVSMHLNNGRDFEFIITNLSNNDSNNKTYMELCDKCYNEYKRKLTEIADKAKEELKQEGWFKSDEK